MTIGKGVGALNAPTKIENLNTHLSHPDEMFTFQLRIWGGTVQFCSYAGEAKTRQSRKQRKKARTKMRKAIYMWTSPIPHSPVRLQLQCSMNAKRPPPPEKKQNKTKQKKRQKRSRKTKIEPKGERERKHTSLEFQPMFLNAQSP
jgi:hypothetical protein